MRRLLMEPHGSAPHALAIVIPAYRARFLGQTLDSLAAQTDQRFQVYLADDGSDEDLAAVVAPFRDRLALEYRRFGDNRGRQSLVGHWRRAIGLSREPWVWLLPDDDEVEAGCVAGFYETLERRGGAAVDLVRFDLDLIDETGTVYRRLAAQPPQESATKAALALLSDDQREWRVSNHVFSRAVYEERGGFPEFPLALFSDYAAWIGFAEPRGVWTVTGPRVRWRHHGDGLSSMFGGRHRGALLAALQAYAAWLFAHAGRVEPEQREEYSRRAGAHVFRLLGLIDPALDRSEIRALASGLRAGRGGWGWAEWMAFGLAVTKGRLRSKPVFRRIARWRLQRTLARRG